MLCFCYLLHPRPRRGVARFTCFQTVAVRRAEILRPLNIERSQNDVRAKEPADAPENNRGVLMRDAAGFISYFISIIFRVAVNLSAVIRMK